MKLKTIKFILVLIVITLAIVGCTNKVVDSVIDINNENKSIYDYFEKNNSIIEVQNLDDFTDLSIIDSDLEGKEIYFTGEYHGTQENGKLKMKFLRYFKEKTGFTYYLCEDSYSGTYFLNKYLNSGDERILEEVYKPLKGTFAGNKDGYNHWKELYEYNKILPEDEKIKIIGVDIEHQTENSYRYFMDVLPDKEIPMEISQIIDQLKDNYYKLNRGEYIDIVQFSKILQKDIFEKEKIYKEYLGGDFFGFNLVNNNILNKYEAYSQRDNDWNNVRDKMIYDNFMDIYAEISPGKFYGQWGLDHAFQSKIQDTMWFAAYLNKKGSIFENKILTIAYFYDNCEFMNQSGIGTNTWSSLSKNSAIKRFNDLLEENITLYKLNGEDIPPELLYESGNIAITDIFQYMVIIKDSKAEEPLLIY